LTRSSQAAHAALHFLCLTNRSDIKAHDDAIKTVEVVVGHRPEVSPRAKVMMSGASSRLRVALAIASTPGRKDLPWHFAGGAARHRLLGNWERNMKKTVAFGRRFGLCYSVEFRGYSVAFGG
jgi:hypothetical protein